MAAKMDVCVIGGGPAGAVTALRLAMFGHRVCLVERCVFPRLHVGESLTPGIWPTIDLLGLRTALLEKGFLPTGDLLIQWGGSGVEAISSAQRGPGLFVDRARFDACLLDAAVSAGVHIVSPGKVHRVEHHDGGWHVQVDHEGRRYEIDSSFLVDASGRSGVMRGKRTYLAPQTTAVWGHVQIADRRQPTLVEALHDGWCWGAPIPGRLFSAMMFVDRAALRPIRRWGLEAYWRNRLAHTELFSWMSKASLVAPLVARDATAYHVVDDLEISLFRVGEASFALDPLSSTGVEKAMQSGLIAAVSLHTILRRPERKKLCVDFCQRRHSEIVSSHAAWSSSFYAEVRQYADEPFWRARSTLATKPEQQPNRTDAVLDINCRIRISPDALLVHEPCIVNDEICVRPALVHPSLQRPIAFIEGVPVWQLLEAVPVNPDLQSILPVWSQQVSGSRAERIASWFMNNRILETV